MLISVLWVPNPSKYGLSDTESSRIYLIANRMTPKSSPMPNNRPSALL